MSDALKRIYDRPRAAMPLLVFAAGILSLLFAERIPVNGGFGFDGARYGAWAMDFWNQVLVRKISAYDASRVLPSACVHYALRLLRLPLDHWHVIKAFQAWNLLWLLVAAFVWTDVADALDLRAKGRWLGFAGLFLNFAILKQSFYYPVLTDSAGFGLGMILLDCFLRERPLGILCVTLLGSFVWPPFLPAGLALYIFPRRQLPVRESPGACNQAAAWPFVSMYLLGTFYIHFLLKIPYQNNASPIDSPLAVISLLLAAGFLWAALTDLFDAEYLNHWEVLGLHISWRWIGALPAIGAAIALAQHAWTDPLLPFPSETTFLFRLTMGSIAKPLGFLVAHFVYFGPIIPVLFFLWPEACSQIQRHGAGLVLFFLYSILLALDPESRHSLAMLPFFAAFAAKAADETPLPPWIPALFAGSGLYLSRFWYRINLELPQDFEPLHFQRYYNFHGPFTSWDYFIPQAGTTLALGAAFWIGLRKKSSGNARFPNLEEISHALPYLLLGLVLLVLSPSLKAGLFSVEDHRILFGMHAAYPWSGWSALSAVQPLSRTSFALDFLFARLDSLGFHFGNLFLHGLNSMGVYWIALKLYGTARENIPPLARVGAAALASALFGLHPMQAGPAGWISQRGYLLSSTFCLGSFWAYLYAREQKPKDFAHQAGLCGSAALFGTSLLASPLGICLPLVLLILDLHVPRQIGSGKNGEVALTRTVLFEYFPFFLIALVYAGFVLFKHGWTAPSSLAQALGNASFFAGKTLFFQNLSPLWPIALHGAPGSLILPANELGILGIVSIALFYFRRCWPACWTSWMAFLLLLLPTAIGLGFSETSEPSLVAGWGYLSLSPLAILAGFGWFWIFYHTPSKFSLPAWKAAPWIGGLTLIAAFAFCSWKQSSIWIQPIRLWEERLESDPSCDSCHANLAWQFMRRGLYDDALRHAGRVLSSKKDYVDAYAWLARIYFSIGKPREAEAAAETCRKLSGPVARFYAEEYYLAGFHLGLGKNLAEAESSTRTAVHLDPSHAIAHANLGILLGQQGHPKEAAAELRTALTLSPDMENARAALRVFAKPTSPER